MIQVVLRKKSLIFSVNKCQRIPKGQFKKGKSSETGNTGHTTRKKNKQRHSIICVGHHFKTNKQTQITQTRHASSYKPLEVKQDTRAPTNLWRSNKTRVILHTSGGQTRHPLQTSGGQTRKTRVFLQTSGGQIRHASSYKPLEGKQDMSPPTNHWRANKTRVLLQTSGGQTRHASYKPLEVKQDTRPPTNLWRSNKTRVLLQTSGGQISHASSYKPLEVKQDTRPPTNLWR